jgi:hypothetical protein
MLKLCASRQKPPSVSVCWLRQHASSQLWRRLARYARALGAGGVTTHEFRVEHGSIQLNSNWTARKSCFLDSLRAPRG